MDALAYDSARSTVLLFGGNSSGYSAGDTWEYHVVTIDGGTPDASADAAMPDATAADVLIADAPAADVLIPDATAADAPIPDAGSLDALAPDALSLDAGASDASSLDALAGSAPDAGTLAASRGCGCDAVQHDRRTRPAVGLSAPVLLMLLFWIRPKSCRWVGRSGCPRSRDHCGQGLTTPRGMGR
jgi:hypothetical protein